MIDYNAIKDAFSDQLIQSFYYDIFGKKLELYYEGYYDIYTQQYKELSCVFIIKDWQKAYSIPYDIEQKITKRYDLDVHMGVFFIIMGMEYDVNTNVFEITINLINNSYCTYIFEQPKMYILEKNKY